MRKLIVFFIVLFHLLIFSKPYIPCIGVVGNASYKNELVEKLCQLYDGLAPVEPKDYQLILKIWKEQDIGLRKKELETSQLPDVDYLIELSGNIVTFYDLSSATMKKISVGSKNPVKSIIDFFQNFVLLFRLPTFVDKTAKIGDWYAVLDENGNVIGYYRNNGISSTITIPVDKYKGAVYARKLRKAIIRDNKVIYEISEKDLNVQIVSSEYFEVFKDGEDVNLTVLIHKGGFLYIFDIYKDDIICVKSAEPVERGSYAFSFTAYKGDEDNVKEMLIFVLERFPIKIGDNLSFVALQRILQMADGVDMITFVVK